MSLTPLNIYRLTYSYIVRIGDIVFEMNENVLCSNGVNMYAGPWEDWEDFVATGACQQADMVPVQVAIAIGQRVAQLCQAESSDK